MYSKTSENLINEVIGFGLPKIKNTSKIQRTIMSATRLSQDDTSIISAYYFPIDIDAIDLNLAPKTIRTIVLLACELGIWPIVRIVTKKYPKILEVNYKGITLVQYLYNSACYNGYYHIGSLLQRIGACMGSGISEIVKGGCVDLFDKYIKLCESKKYLKSIDFNIYLEYLCESLVKKSEDHIDILWVLIRKKVAIKKHHLEKANRLGNNYGEHGQKFLKIIESRMLG